MRYGVIWGRQSIAGALSGIDYKFGIFIHSKEYGNNLYLRDFHEEHLWTIITRAWYVAKGSNGVESNKIWIFPGWVGSKELWCGFCIHKERGISFSLSWANIWIPVRILLAYLFNKYHSVVSCYSFFTKQRITTNSPTFLHLLDFTQQPTLREGGSKRS